MEYHIDATNKILGRLAGEIALVLRGKNQATFDPARVPAVRVTVSHTDKIKVTGKKMIQKRYWRHSGYPGGIRFETLSNLYERDSRIVLRRAVMGMLPKNKLRSRFIKNLIMIRGEKE